MKGIKLLLNGNIFELWHLINNVKFYHCINYDFVTLINSFQILAILSKKEKKKYLHYAVLFDYSFFISDVNCFKFKKLEEKIRYMGAF